MKLNEKIYACRKKAGLSQEALAEMIGVSRQSISKWEVGDAAPEITKLPLLAQAFGVTTDWLLSEEDFPQEEKAAPSPAPEPAPSIFSAPSEAKPPVSSWPSWVEELPGSLSRCIKRYGWLIGLRMVLSGAVVVFFGIVAMMAGNSFMDATDFDNAWPGSMGGSDMDWLMSDSAIWYDEAGNVVDNPFGSSMTPQTRTASIMDPWMIICGFIIVMGVGTMIVGGVLAAVLRKYGREHP